MSSGIYLLLSTCGSECEPRQQPTSSAFSTPHLIGPPQSAEVTCRDGRMSPVSNKAMETAPGLRTSQQRAPAPTSPRSTASITLDFWRSELPVYFLSICHRSANLLMVVHTVKTSLDHELGLFVSVFFYLFFFRVSLLEFILNFGPLVCLLLDCLLLYCWFLCYFPFLLFFHCCACLRAGVVGLFWFCATTGQSSTSQLVGTGLGRRRRSIVVVVFGLAELLYVPTSLGLR